MRLIDADASVESIRNLMGNGATLEQAIDAQPTAYDVGKVMEQINKEYADAIKMLNDDRGTAFEFSAKVRCDSYKRVLEIMKSEGDAK